ncbi:MAG: thiamine phosphate synthase, partial [Pelagibacterales bacterium]|nr:thiamine phosphate synthase [Pelagibacterales bacterium]
MLRKKPPNKKFLYVISPQVITNTNKFLYNLRQVLSSGIVSFFQLRIKSNEKKKIIDLAKKIKPITKRYKVKFIINDSPF